MADMNEWGLRPLRSLRSLRFEDVEARLRRYRASGPPAGVRAAVLAGAAGTARLTPRRGLWRYAAAAALLIALNLGTEQYFSARMDIGAPEGPESARTADGLELLKSLNGAGWPTLAFYLSAGPRSQVSWLPERQALLKGPKE